MCSFRRRKVSSYGATRSDWKTGGPSQSRPSQRSSSSCRSAIPGRTRGVSMSSTRSANPPPSFRAHNQESKAVRAFPRCNSPVGLGANRPRSGFPLMTASLRTLRGSMTTDVLSTRQVAMLLGVGEATVKRWADAGEIDCFRTPGGHRKFRLRDVTAFVNKRQYHVAETLPAQLTPGEEAGGDEAIAAVEKSALAGDASSLVAQMAALRLHGHDLAVIFDDVVAPALQRIGS